MKLTKPIRNRTLISLAVCVVLSIACQESTHSGPASASSPELTAPSSNNLNAQPAPSLSNTKLPADNTSESATAPSIQITAVPSKGAGPDALEAIAGTVAGVNVKECKVVVFARTNVWYVQPYIDSFDTQINDDNTWRTDTHLGSQYAALLVKASYKPPTTTGKLPGTGGPVLAVTTVNAKQ